MLMNTYTHADEIKVFDFTKFELSELQVRKVRGADNKTIYSIGKNESGNFLKAVADNAGSGRGREVKITLNITAPLIPQKIIFFL